MIEFKNVSASYDGELAVLADVSFTVNDGDFVAFVGTNGAGKSTTMRLANGLLKPTSGEVLIDGVPTTSLKTSELARRIGFLFQNPDRQICCNTVREELMFGFAALGEEAVSYTHLDVYKRQPCGPRGAACGPRRPTSRAGPLRVPPPRSPRRRPSGR